VVHAGSGVPPYEIAAVRERRARFSLSNSLVRLVTEPRGAQWLARRPALACRAVRSGSHGGLRSRGALPARGIRASSVRSSEGGKGFNLRCPGSRADHSLRAGWSESPLPDVLRDIFLESCHGGGGHRPASWPTHHSRESDLRTRSSALEARNSPIAGRVNRPCGSTLGSTRDIALALSFSSIVHF
jgi:hypothetical protein